MANVIFGFNGEEISLPMEDTDAKKLFHDITGVSIVDEDFQNDLEIDKDKIEKVNHPTLNQLVELFRANLDNEINTNLIRDNFYPNYKGNWRRIFAIIYDKIQKALDRVELLENGKYLKRKDGKYTIYFFVRNNDKTLNDYL